MPELAIEQRARLLEIAKTNTDLFFKAGESERETVVQSVGSCFLIDDTQQILNSLNSANLNEQAWFRNNGGYPQNSLPATPEQKRHMAILRTTGALCVALQGMTSLVPQQQPPQQQAQQRHGTPVIDPSVVPPPSYDQVVPPQQQQLQPQKVDMGIAQGSQYTQYKTLEQDPKNGHPPAVADMLTRLSLNLTPNTFMLIQPAAVDGQLPQPIKVGKGNAGGIYIEGTNSAGEKRQAYFNTKGEVSTKYKNAKSAQDQPLDPLSASLTWVKDYAQKQICNSQTYKQCAYLDNSAAAAPPQRPPSR